MSGICGSVGTPPGVRDPVARALAVLAARGPDGGRRAEGHLGVLRTTFGVRRLALREPARNKQPAISASGAMLVFDGEIHNVDRLGDELRARGVEVAPGSEAAVLAALITYDGIEGLARIDGHYAFAFLAGPDGPLLLGRDPAGTRPLVFAAFDDALLFASTIDAIVATGAVERRADPEIVGALLRDGVSPGRRAAVRGIERVMPGEVLSFDSSLARLALEIPDGVEEPQGEPDVLDTLRETVFDRLRTDRPVGVLLSGGTDSAIIAALAREAGDVPAWSLTFPGHRTSDDTERVRRTARRLGLSHRLTPCPPDPTPWVLGAARAFDGPCGDPAAVPMWGVARAAGQSVRAVLTGLGGDEVLGGHRRYWLMGAGPWLRQVPTFVQEPVHAVLGRRDRAGLRRARRISGPPGAWRGVLRFHPPRFVRTVLGPVLAAAAEPSLRIGGDAMDLPPEPDLVRQDRALAAHGVEGRHPFLDARVRGAVRAIERTGRSGRKRQKQLLRAFVKDVVDPDLARVGRHGLVFPVDDLYRGPLRPLGQDALMGKGARERGFVSPEGVRQVLRDHASGARNHGLLIHALVMLELWARRVLDGE